MARPLLLQYARQILHDLLALTEIFQHKGTKLWGDMHHQAESAGAACPIARYVYYKWASHRVYDEINLPQRHRGTEIFQHKGTKLWGDMHHQAKSVGATLCVARKLTIITLGDSQNRPYSPLLFTVKKYHFPIKSPQPQPLLNPLRPLRSL